MTVAEPIYYICNVESRVCEHLNAIDVYGHIAEFITV